MKKIPLLAACLFILLLCLPGYANDPHFRHYNNKQGLSHNTVYCSLQDQRGFMWFGTEDGLNRFDGHTFKIYRHNSYNPNSLPNDCIVNLFESSDEKIWIFTARGTCYYDYRTDTFHPFRLSSGQNESESFFAGTEDKDRNLWFIDYNRIVRYNPADSSSRTYPAEEFFHPAIITLTNDGNPLFSDRQSLYTYKAETDNFQKIPFLNETQISNQIALQAVCQIPDLGILSGTNQAGLLLYKYQDQRVVTIIPEIQVRAIIPYNTTIYWIASESGIYIYNTQDQTITNLRKSLTNEYAIADNAVYSLTKDREGGVWAGSFFGGISYLPKEYTRFSYFIGGKTHPQLLGNAIREITPDRYGNLWLGTEDNGINCYNPRTGEITNYSYNNPGHPLSATNIHGLLAVDNQLWVGTFNKGIDVLDIPSGKIIKHYSRENSQTNLNSNFILCFYKTRENELLVGTSNGLMIYNKQTESFSPWNNIYALIRQIYQDSRGDIWVATSNGIYHYLRKENKVEQYRSDSNKSESIGNNNTTSVFEDSKGRIWVTTVSGLSLFNKETQSFNRITTDNGLPSNIVYRIVEDDSHNFWLSTANGLVRFNPETYAMRTYTYTDGLHETQFNYSSSYQAPDGTIYMGTINGMLSFNPSQFKEDTFMPPMYITGINLPDNEENKYNLPTSSIEDTKVLKLPYNASTFTLSYVALSYTSPDAIRYAYKLEGVDKDWNYMDQNKNVTFANLSPGEYTFKVKSTNSSGLWQDNEQSLQIIITPPFWATGWAFFVYIVIICICIVLFYNYKKAKLEEKHRINQDLFESKKEKELYDAKIQFFTFITHEIRTPLTLIKAPLEKIIKSKDSNPSTRENLQIIEKNTQQLLNLSNQLLDFRKTESRGFRLNYVHTDITLWLHTILQPFLPVIEQENKTFTCDIPDESFYAFIDREAFSKIINNLLTNAIKYSDKYISLQLQRQEDRKEFIISVTNDGMLIPDSEIENVFTPFYRLKETEHQLGSGIGLSLARSLAEFHKGSLNYTQTPEGMNRFILTLPKEQEDCYLLTTGKNTEDAITESNDDQNDDKPMILIVEDQEDMRRFIARELAETYRIREAANGKEAICILKDHPVSLILSDVMMPVMDGFELCNVVKNDVNYSHIPFILLTAQHNLQSRLKGLNNGADAYMEKPFSIELLVAQVANLLKSREVLTRTYKETPSTPATSLAVSTVDDLFLRKLNAYLEEHITNDALNVEMLATEMGMSTSSLYRKVKGLSGLSPVEFIKIARLKQAVLLMKNGENRINEIAFRTGFSSPAYFSTCFQKQYGKTPTEFMKEC